MRTTTVESVAGQTPQPASKRSALRWLFHWTCFAIAGMGLAVAAMAQAPSGRPAAEAPAPALSEEAQPSPVVPSIPQCPTQEILAGVQDDFSTGNGVEIAAPSVALQTAIGPPFADFDVAAQSVRFVHTFRLPQCKCLVGAKLEFLAKALGTSGQFSSGNDAITLGFSTLSGFPRWGAHLGSGNPPTAPSLSTPAWGSAPIQRTFTLDLGA